MTKLRKLTALLLAGALTLLLLTACSGGGGSSGPEAQAEAKVMRAIRSNPSTKNLEYDVDMCDIAEDELAKTDLDAELKGYIGGYGVYHKVKIDQANSTLPSSPNTIIRTPSWKNSSNTSLTTVMLPA